MAPITQIALGIATIFVAVFGHGATGIKLLLHDGLRGHNLSKALQSWRLQPRRGICFKGGNDAWLGDFVGSAVVHIYGGKQQDVGFRVCDARCNCFHDFAVNGLFVIGNKVLVEEFLDLVR